MLTHEGLMQNLRNWYDLWSIQDVYINSKPIKGWVSMTKACKQKEKLTLVLTRIHNKNKNK